MEESVYIKEQIQESIAVKTRLLNDIDLIKKIEKVADLCTVAYRNGNKTIFAGNGGSAADAQHFAAEFVSRFYFDRPGLPSIALTTDTSILTAIGNDYGFDKLFSRQLEAQGKEGDIFIGISTSGNSENLVRAREECKKKKIISIALTGLKPCRMDDYDIVIKIPSMETPRIQECQELIGHIICALVEKNLFGK